MLELVLWIAIGGALGSVFRYLFSYFIQAWFGLSFPLGTLLVNLLGSFLIGFFFSFLVEKHLMAPQIRAFLITGCLGGFTTLSTFAIESLNLWQEGLWANFGLYFFLTPIGSLFLAFLGYSLGKLL